jgi:DNA-binding GntR family transcriptional regulator
MPVNRHARDERAPSEVHGADTMRERLVGLLEDEILKGRIEPGAELDERNLATRFGVSRTPVRQALVQLAAGGLIELRSRQPAVVVALDPYRLTEMFETLAGLEAICAELAARRMTVEELRQLEEVHLAIGEAASAGDTETYADANLAFHRLIFAATHNGYLAEQTNSLRSRLQPYRNWMVQKMNRMRLSHEEHGVVLEALRTGNAVDAAEKMRHHVLGAENITDMILSVRR